MARIIILLLFAGMFVGTPLYLLDQVVMPELASLKQVYGNLDEVAAKVVEAKTPEASK